MQFSRSRSFLTQKGSELKATFLLTLRGSGSSIRIHEIYSGRTKSTKQHMVSLKDVFCNCWLNNKCTVPWKKNRFVEHCHIPKEGLHAWHQSSQACFWYDSDYYILSSAREAGSPLKATARAPTRGTPQDPLAHWKGGLLH